MLKMWFAVIKSLWSRESREAVGKQLSRMLKEGVNPWNKAERQSWIRSHRKEVHTAIGSQNCSCGSSHKTKRNRR